MSDITSRISDDNSGRSASPTWNSKSRSAEDPIAVAHEAKVRAELSAQFQELKRQAQGIFEAVKGRVGASHQEYLNQVFAKASEDYASGQFLIQRLGADRHLDLPLVATLTQLRQSLLAGIANPTASDFMLADSAVLAYRNMLRIQGWIGSLALQVQRDLFGQAPLSNLHGGSLAADVAENARRLEATLLPLIDRCQRMMIRALERLEARKSSGHRLAVNIAQAGQVNVAAFVTNALPTDAAPIDGAIELPQERRTQQPAGS